MEMKCLTIREPYASLIRCGKKKIETRSWGTKYRGDLYIHAAKKMYPTTDEFEDYVVNELKVNTCRMGVIHCKVKLVDCVKMTQEFIDSLTDQERNCGFYEVGRYAWILEDVEPYDINEQKVINGHLGIWNA